MYSHNTRFLIKSQEIRQEYFKTSSPRRSRCVPIWTTAHLSSTIINGKVKFKRLFLRTCNYYIETQKNELTAIHVIKRSNTLVTLEYGQRWLVLNPFPSNKHQSIKNFMLQNYTALKGQAGVRIFFCLLLISQQNVLNKSYRECFFRHSFFVSFFVDLYIFGLEGKTIFLGLFAKAYSSHNIHVRHFAFGQCIVYMVSY